MRNDYDGLRRLRLLHRFGNGDSVYFTTAAAGDARRLVSEGLIEKELISRTGVDVRLMTLNQIHSGVVHFLESGDSLHATPAAADGDGMASRESGIGLGILVADCAPVALTSSEGVFGAVHAGWRGVFTGILTEVVRVMRLAGATNISAYVGPSIKRECYEFKGPELDMLADELGPSVKGCTSWGTPSLNIPEAVRRSLATAGVFDVEASSECTACGDGYFSFRARQSTERHLMIVVKGGQG